MVARGATYVKPPPISDMPAYSVIRPKGREGNTQAKLPRCQHTRTGGKGGKAVGLEGGRKGWTEAHGRHALACAYYGALRRLRLALDG